jgi:hypothetical protein
LERAYCENHPHNVSQVESQPWGQALWLSIFNIDPILKYLIKYFWYKSYIGVVVNIFPFWNVYLSNHPKTKLRTPNSWDTSLRQSSEPLSQFPQSNPSDSCYVPEFYTFIVKFE